MEVTNLQPFADSAFIAFGSTGIFRLQQNFRHAYYCYPAPPTSMLVTSTLWVVTPNNDINTISLWSSQQLSYVLYNTCCESESNFHAITWWDGSYIIFTKIELCLWDHNRVIQGELRSVWDVDDLWSNGTGGWIAFIEDFLSNSSLQCNLLSWLSGWWQMPTASWCSPAAGWLSLSLSPDI